MQFGFEHCGRHHEIDADRGSARGWLCCGKCGQLISEVDVADAASWIEWQVQCKRRMHEQGMLGTRKQSAGQDDEQIDRDGLAAEAAACTILCPARFSRWQDTVEQSTGNRGCDLPPTWTGLDRPVEVKQTRYHDAHRGHLLIRPPRWTPGPMQAEYLDDAYYILLHGQPYRYEISGWADRQLLLSDGQRNPVPVSRGQRECWGIHWTRLHPLATLAETIEQREPTTRDPQRSTSVATRLWRRLRGGSARSG